MIINVTQDDINWGIPHSIACCPISLAIGRILKIFAVETSKSVIVADGKTFKMTKACQKFIIRFDYNKPVNPFKFRLMVKS